MRSMSHGSGPEAVHVTGLANYSVCHKGHLHDDLHRTGLAGRSTEVRALTCTVPAAGSSTGNRPDLADERTAYSTPLPFGRPRRAMPSTRRVALSGRQGTQVARDLTRMRVGPIPIEPGVLLQRNEALREVEPPCLGVVRVIE